MTSTLFKLVFFLGFVHYGYGIRCYICQSRSNSACQDPIKSYQLQLTECTPDVLHASSAELGKALNGFGGLGAHLGVDLMAGSHGYPFAPMHCQKISYNVDMVSILDVTSNTQACKIMKVEGAEEAVVTGLIFKEGHIGNIFFNPCPLPMWSIWPPNGVGEERVIVRGCQASTGASGWNNGENRGACSVLEEQANRIQGSYLNYCDICDKDACNVAPTSFALSPFTLTFVLLSSIYAMLR